MSDLRELYQELIVDHSKRPRNFGKLERPTHEADGFNPLCGDKVHLYLSIEGGKVAGVRFEGAGCAISTASASMMTEALKGKTPQEASALFERFRELVTGKADGEDMGKLAVFAGVRDYPARVKCASLAWHTLQSALENKNEVVSTEKGTEEL
ncbi:MAG TPA: SUF system NifU family Fe-S cluster assembly protein [Bdellovibrionota bacterium]|nr:SUF system NifU family Fe-S cluster assembly protein [Bdellovibrionota bacterium]